MAIRKIIYKQNDFTIAYDFINHQKEKNIVFLHGWGSNKELMSLAFRESFKDFNHYYIDLPGFGRSPNNQVLITKDYANIMRLFFTDLKLTPDLIIGHSFGGKIAALLDSEILLLSSAGILEKKSLITKIKIYCAKIFKFLHINSSFLRSKDANNLNIEMYETFKNVVDEDFEKIFSSFKYKATIFWGKSDKATSLESGKKISSLIKNSRFYPLDGDHFFFLKQGKIIDDLYKKGL
ncbi:alpha/beta fold hydrolase [Helicobacter anatolicus]|uniref:alpha/beta fold hydrolase n=1 Tax=Helicobacter anatolicus TaxID=2905874 RepID=UPI001E38E3FE|nr:alpha/beta hydrolase [Helicobacter anatolicus]MCE3037874.1 alpha/beta fold hydrolase [Helicobacter anatolicus]